MCKSKTAKIICVLLGIAALIAVSRFVPVMRKPMLDAMRLPLIVLSAVKREIGALIFFHRNMVVADRLQSENQFLRSKLNQGDEVLRENQRLRKILGFKETAQYKVIAARVIGKNPSNWSSSLIIDRGTASGISKGDVCVTFLGLCGRIADAGRTTSTVTLINDPNLSVSSLVQRSRQEGLVCGSLSGHLLMKYLPKDSDIQVSDTVVTSGLTDVFPKGILIGTVTRIRDEFSGASRYAVVRPAVDLTGIEELLVIIP